MRGENMEYIFEAGGNFRQLGTLKFIQALMIIGESR